MAGKLLIAFFCVLCLGAGFPAGALAGPVDKPSPGDWTLTATMCESLQDNRPINPTHLFSAGNRYAYCWSEFSPVAEKSIVHHVWYRKDKMVARVKLLIHPPRWATYSSIRLRQSDKGPWRVDITGPADEVLQTLRFSITD